MNSKSSFPIVALVFALAAPVCALATDLSPTPNDQKAPNMQKNSKSSIAAEQAPKKADHVVFEGVRLLTTEEDLQGNISVADLTNLIVNIETQTKKVFATTKQPGMLLLSFTSTPTEQNVNLAFQPSELAPVKHLQRLKAALDGLPKLNVKSNSVKFLVQFTLNP